MHAVSVIGTRDLIRPEAANIRFRRHGHRNWIPTSLSAMQNISGHVLFFTRQTPHSS